MVTLKPPSVLLALSRSKSVRATLGFGLAGIANMLGQMLLARQLPEREFALLALFLAFMQVGTSFGAAGAEVIIVRHRLRLDAHLLRSLGPWMFFVGAVLLVLSYQFYSFGFALACLVMALTVASTLVRVAATYFQSTQDFKWALLLHQGHNYVLLAVAVLALALNTQDSMQPGMLLLGSLVIGGVMGWLAANRGTSAADRASMAYPWREAVPLLAFGAATVLSFQAERLLIPELLSVNAVATYAVLATLAGSPFQMLMMGIGFTMTPRLRSSASAAERRHIVRKELLLVTVIVLPSALAVLWLAPFFAHLLTGGRYSLSYGLVAAAVVTGVGKVFSGFVTSVVSALGSERDLRRMGWTAWAGIFTAVLAAVPAARFGLVGIVLATGAGWMVGMALLLPSALRVLEMRRDGDR